MPLDGYTLPEDDPLRCIVMQLDRDLGKGGSGIISQVPEMVWLAIEPLPRRTLEAVERLADLGTPLLDEATVHGLVRQARTFDQAVRQHRTSGIGGPLKAGPDSPWATMTLKAVVPALLAIEAALAKFDKAPAPTRGLVEAIAEEIRREGTVWPFPERFYRALGEIARRVLAMEARLGSIESPTPKASKP